MPSRLKKGFTLIELLIVIAIIATLSAVLVANLLSAQNSAKDVSTKGYMNQVIKQTATTLMTHNISCFVFINY